MERDEIEILIGDEPFNSWKSLRIQHSMEAVAGTISLTARDPEDWPGSFQERVQVLVGGEPVFTGHFDTVQAALGDTGRSLSASGRSLTADAVDSTVDPEFNPVQLTDVNLFEVALVYVQRALGINVTHRLDEIPPVPRFSAQPGETLYAQVERACRLHGVLCMSDGYGRLVMTRPASERSGGELLEGVNVRSVTVTVDHSNRFNYLKVTGQGTPSDDWNGTEALQPSASVEDHSVRPTRTVLVMADGEVDGPGCLTRAQWDLAMRAARGTRAVVDVLGFRAEDGQLWLPNHLVAVELPTMRYSGDMLIESVTLSIDDQGRKTTLGLVRPDAYSAQPSLALVDDPGRALLSGSGGAA